MTRAERLAQIRGLQREHPDWTHKQIADAIGVTLSAVRNVLNDPDGSKQRARRATYVGSCEDCGAVTRSDGTSRPSPTCAPCAHARSKYWTKERVLDAIQRFARVHGRPPLADEWINADFENSYPARSSVYQSGTHSAVFASWADAIEAAGFTRPLVGKREGERWWSRDEVIAELQRLAVDGVAPSADTPGSLHKMAVYYLGSWQAACTAAALTPRRAAMRMAA